MYKICVVGLGGSGGKTLQFLMDQLRTELTGAGWERPHLPKCWEFVHIDVPPAPDGIGPGLPATVPSQGGSYIPVTTPGDSYAVLDSAVEQALTKHPQGSQLHQLARWRPIPAHVGTEITKGAGQFRAIGRLLTLSRAQHIYNGLVSAGDRLNSSAASEELQVLGRTLGFAPGGQASDQGTMLLVVSSLAGGTGASMTLDVCNLLRAVAGQVPNFPPDAIAFLYTPDVFAQLKGSDRTGVNANALGTVSELMAALSAAREPWTADQWAIYGGVPKPQQPGRGPAAVIPVGSTNGVSGQAFGDRTQDTIYRGLARSLAAMYLSESQTNSLLAYAIGNRASTMMGLGDVTDLIDQPAVSPAQPRSNVKPYFGSIGFASLGLGRDRYAEYAAQRLARGAVEKLLRGHHDRAVLTQEKSPDEAVREYGAIAYPLFLDWAGLPNPARGDVLGGWVDDVWAAAARGEVGSRAAQEAVAPVMQPGLNERASYFAQQLTGLISNAVPGLMSTTDQDLRAAAGRWVPAIQSRVETALLRVVGEFGLPVAVSVVDRLTTDIEVLTGRLVQAGTISSNAQSIAADSTAQLQTVNNRMDARHGVLGQAVARVRDHFTELVNRRAAALVGQLLPQLVTHLLQPLRTGLVDTTRELGHEENKQAPAAAVRTTHVPSWPRAGESVPQRFGTAHNEVLLEDASTYPSLFADQVQLTFQDDQLRPSVEQAEERAVFEAATWFESGRGVLRGVAGLASVAPDRSPSRLGRRSDWWPAALSDQNQARKSRYEPQFTPEPLLEATRAWVGRVGQPLQRFTGQSLGDHLRMEGHGAYDRAAVVDAFVDKFLLAVRLAAPLVAVDAHLVKQVHGQEVKLDYEFSELPLAEDADLAARLRQALTQLPSLGDTTMRGFDGAISTVNRQRIDILGHYAAPYSPVVFSSLQQPIRSQWNEALASGSDIRRGFWTHRRGRPLAEFAPVSPLWLQSMITGFLVGRQVGEVVYPAEGSGSQGIAVWSVERRALEPLPYPMLGVDTLAEAPGWAVLAPLVESLALAIAQCDGDPGLTALRPYRSLFHLGAELQDTARRTASTAIENWVGRGVSRSGIRPRHDDPPAPDAEGRKEAIATRLQRLRTSAVSLVRAELPLQGDRGDFARITPHNVWQVSADWELAPQLTTACDQVLADLELAGVKDPYDPFAQVGGGARIEDPV